MIRVLVVGEAERAAAKRLVEFAGRSENRYKPGPGAIIPGEDPNYVLQLWDYRCVFTITEHDGLWRHLSVSVPAKDKLPNPAAVEEIAHLFGITGLLAEWIENGHVAPNPAENCVVVLQKLPNQGEQPCQTSKKP